VSATRPIRCLGVVNRGDAAMRCIRAVKALRAREGSGMRAVVLYTDVDRDAPFVRHADAAVRLPAPAGEVRAYLDHELVIGALVRAGADAVWPGWGFVAEDPVFADRVVAAGMRFLGPSGDAMRALGDKIAAKELAERAGVPVTPWSGGVVEDEQAAARIAEHLGYPVVVKAAAGGGGRGIRVVESGRALPAAFRSAEAEARAAFGDGRLFLERHVTGARHVEVQIAADLHGRVLALGARDCSVQRRHQKLVEEAPPPGLEPALLARLAAAAVRLARTVRFCGLGTVEFLVGGDEAHFLEMNPRLQVEHGITEEVTGLDLVELQIRIARGESLAGTRVRERAVAVEARVCAEDPDAGFVPAPGRIARFDPPLGRGIRVDTGVAAGSAVPAAFDSLIAKVIATGATRDEARGRLVAALRDLDLVIEGGATNTGYLIDVLDSAEFRRGGVDTGWIDRRARDAGVEADADTSDALVGAAILAYQRRRRDARVNFFADTTNVSAARVPPSLGQEVDLSFGGVGYRLAVFAVGSWRYRVQLDGRAVGVALREGDGHLAQLEFADRTRRVVYDGTEIGLRLELDGRPYRFGWETTGHVRAAAPAVVVGVQVSPGDRVAAGQVLGFLEAMKVEIGFLASIAGVVREVRVAKGQLVAAGDVLVVVEPEAGSSVDGDGGSRLTLGTDPDPLGTLSVGAPTSGPGPCDLAALDTWEASARRSAIAALRDETRAVLLGYDADPERARWLATLLESSDPGALSASLRDDLTALTAEVVVFADLEQLFVTAPRTVGGVVVPSNAARLRAYVRRMRAAGAGIAEDFLALLRVALGHYGITSLDHGDSLERALLRLFATQSVPELRRQLVGTVLRCLTALARAGAALSVDAALADALDRIAAMRGLVPDALADAAIAAHAVIFDGPALDHRGEHAAKRVAPWLATAAIAPSPLPPAILLDLAATPRQVFDRMGRWLFEPDPCRRDVALATYLLRLYAADGPVALTALRRGSIEAQRLDLPDGRVAIGVTSTAERVADTARRACRAIGAGELVDGRSTVDAVEIVVLGEDGQDRDAVVAGVTGALDVAGLPAGRCTLSFVRQGGSDLHHTLVRTPGGVREETSLLALHPEAAARVGFARLRNFVLERLPGDDDLYCFWGRSPAVPEDERLFVLAEVRGRTTEEASDAAVHVGAFEQAFHAATSALRALRSARDPRRRLHWNRIAIAVGPAIDLDPPTMHDIARRLAPATRHLGLEKVLVRLRLRDREQGTLSAPFELVASDLTGNHLEIEVREPRTTVLEPADHYERKVVEARRRRLVYPYEIVRMRGRHNGSGPAVAFEEYDLDPGAAVPRAVSVAGRPYGGNRAAVVFGIVTTPTDKVPEGMRRVLVLSDPTREMGALAAPECDRIVAAIDLAERRGLPVEWVPISSGARIAMDSGTENLDATARVVRRIITFAERGGAIHVIVYGVNVGAQSYWNALATMLGHTRGILVMTPDASMVLTGRAALEASGAVAAEDEVALGGFERIMGPNGEAQHYAADLATAFQTLDEHYRYTYVVPRESSPRWHRTTDPFTRDITRFAYPAGLGHGFASVGEIFDDATNPGRKRPFAMRAVMQALVDQDGGSHERWRSWAGAETAIVWDAHLGGVPICLIGIESHNVPREGYRPLDGPDAWSGGTLFPLSSKKVARALNAASGNRPAVILANLSGFDGSPESLRELQLEHGAEIARAVVHFDGPVFFVIVSRYHGGAYVVFSKSLNPRLRVLALTGSYASVIGGSAAAAVVFAREVRARAAADPTVARAREALRADPSAASRAAYEHALEEATRAANVAVAREFDGIHTVERACRVGSLDEIIEPARARPALIHALHAVCEDPRNRHGRVDSVRVLHA
jgi:acetyl/propionyl-CoA carboxylase alpha subunit/acetyl-CoA carboxylase carboxyltransferase component